MKNQEIEKENTPSEEELYSESVLKYENSKAMYYASIITLIFVSLTGIFSLYYAYKANFSYTPYTDFITLDKDNRVLEEVPLNQKNKEEQELTQEIADYLKEAFAYDYIDINTIGVKFKPKMTETAYADFMSAFNNLRIQDKIAKENGIVKPKIVQNLSVKKVGMVGNRFAWLIEGKILLEIYYGNLGKSAPERIIYDIKIQANRTTYKENKDGYLISQLNLGF